MKPAHSPRADKAQVKLLVVREGALQDSLFASLPNHLQAGDLLVVNDAATLPASLHARDASGNPLEVRLAAQLGDQVWRAVTFGAGDWRTPTEDRPSPPRLQTGAEVVFSEDFRARVIGENALSGRLLDLEFSRAGAEFWRDLYRHGKPVQYSYMNQAVELWSVQNVYGSRPWAVEMPSAGHALNWQTLLRLIGKGVKIAALTHGAGLSSTGDAELDQALPLAERFDVPQATVEAIRQTRAAGGDVIAVGTSVVRALESWALGLTGFTDLKIGPEHRLRAVDGLLTGTHDVSESHYQLLQAFLSEYALRRVSRHLDEHDYLTHEFGDACLILPRAGGKRSDGKMCDREIRAG